MQRIKQLGIDAMLADINRTPNIFGGLGKVSAKSQSNQTMLYELDVTNRSVYPRTESRDRTRFKPHTDRYSTISGGGISSSITHTSHRDFHLFQPTRESRVIGVDIASSIEHSIQLTCGALENGVNIAFHFPASDMVDVKAEIQKVINEGLAGERAGISIEPMEGANYFGGVRMFASEDSYNGGRLKSLIDRFAIIRLASISRSKTPVQRNREEEQEIQRINVLQRQGWQ